MTQAFNMDCMQAMKEFPDKFFDLAIVDPPYGIDASEMQMGLGKKKWVKGKKWDSSTPGNDYFSELERVSKNRIIWGGNYFSDKLPISRGWIFWDKDVQPDLSFSSGELAWTSFNRTLKKANIDYSGFRGSSGEKIHPTQKPIALYTWTLNNYAILGDKILDTHLGSGSSRISAHDMGFDFWGYELDKDYFDAQEKRFAAHAAQQKMFVPEAKTYQQGDLGW
jgi:site-specific DNA-methyltransferase (adenine-specific)